MEIIIFLALTALEVFNSLVLGILTFFMANIFLVGFGGPPISYFAACFITFVIIVLCDLHRIKRIDKEIRENYNAIDENI